MRPTQILSSEHRVIEVVLACLEKMTNNALEAKKLDGEAASMAVEFIRNFADKCHHGKEETHLFTLLVDKGMPKEGGPVGVMLQEHELGRAFVKGMSEAIAGATGGDDDQLSAFVSNARGYVNLLKSHIQKEDNVLFPMADRFLTGDDQEKLLADFHTVEHDHMGEGTHDKYLSIAKALAAKYGVSAEGIANHSCGCAHK